jgi:hypothetical protein
MLSMLQQGILARAKEIVEEKDYNLLCKRANICPICGSGLTEDRAMREKKRKASYEGGMISFGAAMSTANMPTQKCVVHGFQW